jgi:hypothetical protein
MTDETSSQTDQAKPRWQPLSAVDRRVAGVLVEKAKTTPGAYPISLNAVTTGCNQKSNRDPAMNIEPDDVEESLDRLRKLGAVGLVEGYGRVAKYRHYLYDWLGVDKLELAVMAELLLRGAQTIGELRGRAARMEPIRDVAELEPVLDSLESKGLLLSLTRKGRGQIVTHALYSAGELQRLKAQYSGYVESPTTEPPPAASATPAARPAPAACATAEPASQQSADRRTAESLSQTLQELRNELAQLRADLNELAEAHAQTEDELHRLRKELGA